MRLLISALFDEDSPLDYIFDSRINTDDPDVLQANHKLGHEQALVIWGGEDIATGLYDQLPATRYTDAKVEMSRRDAAEVALARQAMELGIPIIGVCRGAQLMCALSGGSLIQHVEGHAGRSHVAVTRDGTRIMTNSVHHQMMNPFKVDHELIAWVPEKISGVYIGNNGEEVKEAYSKDFREPEIVWFPKTKSLCIQGHPEYGNAPASFIREVYRNVNKYILQS